MNSTNNSQENVIMAPFQSRINNRVRKSTSAQSQLSQSLVLPKGVSLIDNTLAQACSLQRTNVKRSASAPRLSTKFTYKNRTQGSASNTTVKIISTGSSSNNTSPRNSSADISESAIEDMCPYTFIESVLVGSGSGSGEPAADVDEMDQDHAACSKSCGPLHETDFLAPTEEEIAAYSNDAISAVRTSDVDALRRIYYTQGQTLRCCNRFGESLLHVACRRSNVDVVSFLLNEANVSPRIKDDYGRTPLHDACWRGNPEYDIVELLLSVEPRLAFVSDVRGHKPFNYARREHWGAWKDFLDQKRDLILS